MVTITLSLLTSMQRIGELADGQVTADSDPFDVASVSSKPSLLLNLYVAAPGLSFNNLMTKRVARAMTAFAGSIGVWYCRNSGAGKWVQTVTSKRLRRMRFPMYPLTIEQSLIFFPLFLEVEAALTRLILKHLRRTKVNDANQKNAEAAKLENQPAEGAIPIIGWGCRQKVSGLMIY